MTDVMSLNTELLSSSRLVLHMFVPFFGSKPDNELLLLRRVS